MADSFGNNDGAGGGTNLKRLVATPAFLVIAAIAIGALVWLWFSSRRQAASAAQAGVVANPLTGPAEGPQVLSTFDTTGLQQQLSNLTAQVSTGLAGQTQPTAAGPLEPLGSTPGPDAGFFFGPPPSAIPAGKKLEWRYTSPFVQHHPDLPDVNSNIGMGYGPSDPNATANKYAYSWEWTVA